VYFAIGLMQLQPATAKGIAKYTGGSKFVLSDLDDPEINVRYGAWYLHHLMQKYDGDERLALAAYNAGPGAVDKNGKTVPPFRETRDYVSRVNGLAGTSSGSPSSPRSRIYRVVEIIDGREIVKYTDQDPNER